MQIYFLVYNIYGMGGTVRTVVNTANYMASKGYKVEIISVRRTRHKPIFSLSDKVKITPLIEARNGKIYPPEMPFWKKAIKKVLWWLPSVLIDKSEDLYHMFTLFTDIKIMQKLKSLKNGVLITTIPSFNILSAKYVDRSVVKIGQEHKYFKGHHPKLRRKIQKYYSRLDYLTCLTDSEISDYRRVLDTNNLKIIKMENATKIPIQTASLDEKVVIAAGRYSYEKGFDMLINAFNKVSEKHPDWKLKIFGDGSERGSLQQLIIDKDLYNNVYLIPTTNNILKEMNNSSIYALSSRYESFGMVIIEAMSVGVPCVSFACSGPREIIKHEEDGILVEEGNVDKFAEALCRLIEDEKLRKTYGRNAKKNVERYSFDSIGKKWEDLLQEIKIRYNGKVK